jgi:hypothetical protein
MYWDEIKNGFLEVRSISSKGYEDILRYSEECRQKLYELLDDEGIIILEKYLCCVELLSKQSEYIDNK